MAIIATGSSTCSLCGEALKENDEVVSWAAFLDQGSQAMEIFRFRNAFGVLQELGAQG